jgi:hypothetical protein
MKNPQKLVVLIAFFLFINDVSFSQGPPPWAPAHGYRAKTRYVFFPDHNVYYDLTARNYIVLRGSRWEVRATLPKLFANINLRRSSQVEIDFVGDRPQRYHTLHLAKYKRGKKSKDKKVIIFDQPHPKHNNGHRGHGHGKK